MTKPREEVVPVPQYLYRIQPARAGFFAAPTPEESAAVDRHYEYLVDLTRHGGILLAGRTLNEDASSFGIVLFVAASDAAAHDLMRADPAVAAGVFKAELFPYRTALVSPRLLAAQDESGIPD
jgi:uncharacterized protein